MNQKFRQSYECAQGYEYVPIDPRPPYGVPGVDSISDSKIGSKRSRILHTAFSGSCDRNKP
jgi:hypothetical protein